MNPEVNSEVVTALVRARLDATVESTSVTRAASGNAQEIWMITARSPDGARELVLRRSAGAGPLERTDRAREFTVLRALSDCGFPVPRVHWLETTPSALGRPYFVMDRLPGTPPSPIATEEQASIGRQLGAWLARLHALTPAELPGDVPRARDAASATLLEVRRWQEEYRRTPVAPVPMLGALFGWLEAQPPAPKRGPCLLWGDPGPHNLLTDGRRVTGLLDWELTHAGDPLEDLGAAAWAAVASGFDPEHVVAGYEERAGPVDRAALRYFQALACATRSVMLLSGVAAWQSGQARPGAAALGQHLLLSNLLRGAVYAGWAAAGELPETSPSASVAAVQAAGVSPWRLRPDVTETLDGVARFLREDVLPEVTDARLRRELKTAAALLETASVRAVHEPALPDPFAEAPDQLEAQAVQAERERLPARVELRRLLLADLANRRALLSPLDRLYGVT